MQRQWQENEKPRFCDPAACGHCQDMGNGDFVCIKDPTMRLGVQVVKGWETTQHYLYCKRRPQRRRSDRR